MAAKATAIFDGDDSRLQRVFTGINRKLLDLQSKFAGGAKFLAKMFAAPAAAGAAIAVGVHKVMESAGHFNDLSNRIGGSVGELMAFELQLKNSGVAAEDSQKILAKMAATVATGNKDGFLRQLGLDPATLRNQSPVAQFNAIGEAIQKLENPSDRTAAAMEIFGKSGAQLGSVFADKGFGDAAAQIGSQAELMNKDAALFDDVGDKLGLIGLKLQGFFVGVADQVVPVLKPLLDSFAQLDLAKYGQDVGQAIAFVAQAFADDKLGSIIAESFTIQAKNFGNLVLSGLGAIGGALGELFMGAGETLLRELEILTTYDFWAGLGNSLLAAGQAFIGLLLHGVAEMLKYIGKAPGLGKVGKAGEATENASATMYALAGANLDAAAKNFEQPLASIKELFMDRLAAIGDAFVKGGELGGSTFDATQNQSRLDELVGSVFTAMDAQRTKALTEVPTNAPKTGTAVLAELLHPEQQVPVGALARIGGAFGRGVADPHLEAQRETNAILRQIRDKQPSNGKPQKVEVVGSYG